MWRRINIGDTFIQVPSAWRRWIAVIGVRTYQFEQRIDGSIWTYARGTNQVWRPVSPAVMPADPRDVRRAS